jgi:pyrimidine operon attenuation protein / uracil phosphoribosyltransferase
VELREKATVMDQETMRRAVTRMAHEIVERNKGASTLCLIGIRRRGVHLAARLADAIAGAEGVRIPVGTLDVTEYRDDRDVRVRSSASGVSQSRVHGVSQELPQAESATHIPFEVAGRRIILVDDVLYTGRTVRAALDALIDRGRPESIQLAVLIDRGHRELPIRPDYVGKNLPTSAREMVTVRLAESDGRDEVVIEEPALQ